MPLTTSRATATTCAGEYPKLREHLGAVVAYMTMSKDYFDFMDKLDRFQPKYGQIALPFDYEPDTADDGNGL
jgi:hypothetical protein